MTECAKPSACALLVLLIIVEETAASLVAAEKSSGVLLLLSLSAEETTSCILLLPAKESTTAGTGLLGLGTTEQALACGLLLICGLLTSEERVLGLGALGILSEEGTLLLKLWLPSPAKK